MMRVMVRLSRVARDRRQRRSHTLKRDGFRSKRHRALAYCLSMIFSENRCPLFRIMLQGNKAAHSEKALRWAVGWQEDQGLST